MIVAVLSPDSLIVKYFMTLCMFELFPDTQHAFLSKTDYATTGGEALWTLSNVYISKNHVPSVKTRTQIDLNRTCVKEFTNLNIYINIYIPDFKKKSNKSGLNF